MAAQPFKLNQILPPLRRSRKVSSYPYGVKQLSAASYPTGFMNTITHTLSCDLYYVASMCIPHFLIRIHTTIDYLAILQTSSVQ